jgi:hypothetical protein
MNEEEIVVLHKKNTLK